MTAMPPLAQDHLEAISPNLPLMEDYYTIQGEGYHSGRAAHFIRLGGCDVGCVWCDVKESWDAVKHPQYSIDAIVQKTLSVDAKTVVVTGGEPFMYNLELLCKTYHQHGIALFVETSGAYLPSGSWDWICVSPKKFKAPLKEMLQKANELKVIIYNSSDFNWGETHAAEVSKDCHLYLQPEWSRSKTMLPEIIEYVKRNPQWKISLQTHKFMDIP
jgi:7-carboxy-7-deazaguanine synthase